MKKLLLSVCVLGFIACQPVANINIVPPPGGDPSEGTDPEPEPDPDPVVTPSGERVPLSASITHVQPMTGLVLWTDSESKASYVQLEFSYMLYNKICKKKDVYDWSAMDDLLAEVASRKHQAVVRFRYVYPGQSSNAVPDYIKKLDGYEEITYNTQGDGKAVYPDWRCAELQRFHKEFHRRFAERYDNDPRLAFLETGFGHWAEYHVYGGKLIKGQTFPSADFQKEFLPMMDEWFKDTPWMISIDAADDDYGSPFPSTESLLQLDFGNFDDSFMCEDHDGYNLDCWTFFGPQRYKKAPFGGEFSYFDDNGKNYDQKHCLDVGGMYGRKFEDEVAKYHMTFIIGADQPKYQKESRLKDASMAMGYKFEIRDYRVDTDASYVLIANVGVAPIYRSAYVAIDGKRSAYDLRKLMPGTEVWVSVPGKADTSLKPSIVCDHLVSGQSIEYQANVK